MLSMNSIQRGVSFRNVRTKNENQGQWHFAIYLCLRNKINKNKNIERRNKSHKHEFIKLFNNLLKHFHWFFPDFSRFSLDLLKRAHFPGSPGFPDPVENPALNGSV